MGFNPMDVLLFRYVVREGEGAGGGPRTTATVVVDGEVLGVGGGPNKRYARMAAAKEACTRLLGKEHVRDQDGRDT